MAEYFPGRKLIRSFTTASPNGRERIVWQIFEEWRDIDEGTVVRCGMEATCTIELARGISERTVSTLKEVAGGTLGLKDLWSLKAELEKTMGFEVNWQVTDKTTKTFKIDRAPKCGRISLVIHQLFRIYELTTFRKRFFTFSDEKWARLGTRTFEERTNNHDGLCSPIEPDPICGCDDPPPGRKYDGLLSIITKSLNMRVPFRITHAGLEAQIGRNIVTFPSDNLPAVSRGLETGLDTQIPVSVMPEPLRYLADLGDAKEVDVRLKRFVVERANDPLSEHMGDDPEFELAIPAEHWLAGDRRPSISDSSQNFEAAGP